MPVSDHTPRLNYLRDSGHFLDSLSPSTAAYIRSVHNQILHSQFKSLNQRQKDSFCGACGTIRAPEKTKTVEIKKKPVSKVSKKASDAATIYKCHRCHRRTTKRSRRDPTLSSRPKTTTETNSTSTIQQPTERPSQQPGPQPGAELAEEDKPSKSAENASSKKRAKTRKGGLQALLASKQQSSKPSLDLFDFLQ